MLVLKHKAMKIDTFSRRFVTVIAQNHSASTGFLLKNAPGDHEGRSVSTAMHVAIGRNSENQ